MQRLSSMARHGSAAKLVKVEVHPAWHSKVFGFFGFFIGMAMGMAFEKGKIFLPRVIKAQMTFQDFSMMKMFLAGTSAGMLGVALMVAAGIQNRSATKLALGFGRLRGFGANLVGGLVMGAGIYVSGACPGTLMAQLGAGVPYAVFTVAGALAGVMAFAVVHRAAASTPFMERQPTEQVDTWLGWPMWKVAAVFAVVVGVVVGLLEYLMPYTSTLSAHVAGYAASALPSPVPFDPWAPVWSPIMAGVAMGLLQLPTYWLLDQNIGASGSYVTVCGLACGPSAFPYFSRFFGPGDFAQLTSSLGIAAGSYLSAYLSGVTVQFDDPEASAARSFVGGFLVLFGARLAGGCASGHGLSGIARLSVGSLVVSAAMFAGAIGMGMFATYLW